MTKIGLKQNGDQFCPTVNKISLSGGCIHYMYSISHETLRFVENFNENNTF